MSQGELEEKKKKTANPSKTKKKNPAEKRPP